MLRRLLAIGVTLGLAQDPCTGVDAPGGGVNSPCTRPFDCQSGLTCEAGVCVPLDASADAAGDAPAEAADAGDAGSDGSGGDASPEAAEGGPHRDASDAH